MVALLLYYSRTIRSISDSKHGPQTTNTRTGSECFERVGKDGVEIRVVIVRTVQLGMKWGVYPAFLLCSSGWGMTSSYVNIKHFVLGVLIPNYWVLKHRFHHFPFYKFDALSIAKIWTFQGTVNWFDNHIESSWDILICVRSLAVVCRKWQKNPSFPNFLARHTLVITVA